MIVLCALISSVEERIDMEAFARERPSRLRGFEITATPTLLEMPDLCGAVVTD